jgi:hypothetical protein
MAQNYNQPSNVTPGAISEPTDGRGTVENLKFCTGDIQIIGVHQDFILGTYGNKDGSGGLFITNGSSCFHIDENRNIHIKTGKSAEDGASGGNLLLRSDDFMQTVEGGYALEISGTDDKTTASSDGSKLEKEPAYSITVYGDANIVSTGGDLKLAGDNILLNAKEQVKIQAGNQILATSGDGSGRIDFLGGEVKTTAKFAKFDLTGTFTVDGAEEIALNQKLAVDPISGAVKINTPGAATAVNSMGTKSSVIIGPEKITSLGNLQLEGYKVISQSVGGVGTVTTGPIAEYSLSQYYGTFVGTPREGSLSLNAYDLYTGGSIGTSYKLTGMDVNLDSLGTITGRSVSIVDFIGTLILLN